MPAKPLAISHALGELPIPPEGARRTVQGLRGLVFRQAAEVAQFHHSRLARRHLRELVEGLIQREDETVRSPLPQACNSSVISPDPSFKKVSHAGCRCARMRRPNAAIVVRAQGYADQLFGNIGMRLRWQADTRRYEGGIVIMLAENWAASAAGGGSCVWSAGAVGA